MTGGFVFKGELKFIARMQCRGKGISIKMHLRCIYGQGEGRRNSRFSPFSPGSIKYYKSSSSYIIDCWGPKAIKLKTYS